LAVGLLESGDWLAAENALSAAGAVGAVGVAGAQERSLWSGRCHAPPQHALTLTAAVVHHQFGFQPNKYGR